MKHFLKIERVAEGVKIFLSTAVFLCCWFETSAQVTDTILSENKGSRYSNEYFVSVGYNYSNASFFDFGLRYYRWKNDGQTSLSFAGPAIGCKFGSRELEPIVVPYIGWQGQAFFLGYGIRAEYAIWNGKESFALSPELGFSVFEIVRITGGYRFGFEKTDPVDLNGFTFSAIIGIPLRFLNK